jgi:hypothetical protein
MLSKTRTQPPYAEPLPVQVREGLVVAVAVEESAASPPPAAAAVMGEEQTVSEMAVPQATLEPQAGAVSGDNDVVMVLADQGASLPPPTRELEVAAPVAPEIPAAATTPSSGGAENLPMSRYLSISGIGIIDLDAIELPINDREILEAVTDRVFTNLSALEPEIPEAAVSIAVTSAGVGTLSSATLASDATVSEQSAPRQILAKQDHIYRQAS